MLKKVFRYFLKKESFSLKVNKRGYDYEFICIDEMDV